MGMGLKVRGSSFIDEVRSVSHVSPLDSFGSSSFPSHVLFCCFGVVLFLDQGAVQDLLDHVDPLQELQPLYSRVLAQLQPSLLALVRRPVEFRGDAAPDDLRVVGGAEDSNALNEFHIVTDLPVPHRLLDLDSIEPLLAALRTSASAQFTGDGTPWNVLSISQFFDQFFQLFCLVFCPVSFLASQFQGQ